MRRPDFDEGMADLVLAVLFVAYIVVVFVFKRGL